MSLTSTIFLQLQEELLLTAFASLAARNILRSVELRQPKSLTGMASMPCVKMSHWAISGEICASIQIFTPRG